MAGTSIFDLTGRKAVVTGANRGIGRQLAEALATAGADVAVTARQAETLRETMATIEALGRRAVPLVLDVTDAAACREQMAAAAGRLGGLDILVNNAGTEEVCPSLDVDEALWDRILDTNLKGAFFCAQEAARQMLNRQTKGAILNLCSLTSEVGVPGAVPYGSSKSGLLGMTRALAAEWAPLGIRVNAVAPGYFRTSMTEVFYRNQAWAKAMLEKIPLGRFGDLPDLAGAAIFLVSDAAAYITGQCLGIDGGYLASI
jgi:NAD(P)-dependent dehydrogenase (short-subunit alcohol dehydrogenase family)